jgi:glycosyltransferase involved in cell wall biosynthesis
MRVRVIDYLGSHGGGARFVTETVRALVATGEPAVEIVSHGGALERYRALLSGEPAIRFASIPPANFWRTRSPGGLPGGWILARLAGLPQFHFDVRAAALEDCDVAWLPWLHQHRIPWSRAGRVVASLHDVILIDFREYFPRRWTRDEEKTVRAWLASGARIAVSSNATAATLKRLFGTAPERVRVIPLSGRHQRPQGVALPAGWGFADRPYLLCPANASRHKNLDVLLEGFAAWGARVPLVLTGARTDLWGPGPDPRREELRRIAERLGLRRDVDVFALGYVDDPAYYGLLDRAWALVVPTLAEGGGSFPVMEAMHAGIPVLASDIPVMREMAGRMGGELLWFDPRSPAELARRLEELEAGHAALAERARAQVSRLRTRSWGEVARDYGTLLHEVGRGRG